MLELNSPLDDSEIRKIDSFIIENEAVLLNLKDENVKTIQNFITSINYFRLSFKGLSTDEELKAWNYLYNQTLTLRKNGFFYDKYSKIDRTKKDIGKSNNLIFGIILTLILIGIIAVIVAMCSSGKDESREKNKEAFIILNSQEAIKRKLKDSSSAEFRNMKGICGEVNAKNGFGGYVGFKRYIASGDIAVIEGEIDQSEFNQV